MPNSPKYDVAATRRLVERVVEEALVKMREVMARYDPGSPQAFALRARVRELRALAEEYGIRAGAGRLGKLFAEVGAQGARDALAGAGATTAARAFLGPTREIVDAGMARAESLITDILLDGVRVVNAVVTQYRVTPGAKPADLSRLIQKRLRLGEDKYQVPKWRADLIAEHEPFAMYRQEAFTAATDEGFDLFTMAGPKDTRTSAICRKYVGQTHSIKRWKEIAVRSGAHKDGNKLFSDGFHPRCRHNWIVAVKKEAA